jgi:uncharacterized protein
MPENRHKDCLRVIDRYLLSDRAPENSMGLSDLDGFLTGIVVGPELILPSEGLPVIWGGDSPEFKNAREAHSVTSAIMERYNELVWGFQKNQPSFDPVFWETKDGLVIAADWAEGFYDALNLRPKAWDVLFEDQTGLRLMEPIIILLISP